MYFPCEYELDSQDKKKRNLVEHIISLKYNTDIEHHVQSTKFINTVIQENVFQFSSGSTRHTYVPCLLALAREDGGRLQQWQSGLG